MTCFISSLSGIKAVAVESLPPSGDVSQESDTSIELERAYNLLKQFASETDGLRLVEEEELTGGYTGELAEEFKNKVVLEYYWADEDVILPLVQAFMEENAIDTSLVTFTFLISDEPESDTSIELERAYNLLKQFASETDGLRLVEEEELTGGYTGELAEEFKNKVVLEYYWADEDVILPLVQAFMEENAIDTSLVTFTFLISEETNINTTVNPDVENTTTITTTTTTTVETEKITDIEQIREMFTKFIADYELDAKCVSDEAYPQYGGTVVIEFNSETAANTAILEYAEKSNIERAAFNLVPCMNGKPMSTANPDVENTTTTTTTTTIDGTNTDLPQTGNNSVTNILIAIAALMLTAAGAGAVNSSGILRRKEDDK
ncbi:MAG: LPXTG cell wall anchor domain-containing protein [Oscillospiraceae bacterium]|nr:LPXTG cell wall anchor domain-containing protein [Oscillospiraceae bacterium]